jgi:hypothetical protein
MSRVAFWVGHGREAGLLDNTYGKGSKVTDSPSPNYTTHKGHVPKWKLCTIGKQCDVATNPYFTRTVPHVEAKEIIAVLSSSLRELNKLNLQIYFLIIRTYL